MEHRNITGLDALHPFTIRQAVDPGAIGADKGWLDTSTNPPTLRLRNAANTAWELPKGASDAPPAGGRTSPDVTTYLSKNARFNPRDFQANPALDIGDGATEAGDAIVAAEAVAPALAGIFHQHGTYRHGVNRNYTKIHHFDPGAIHKPLAGVNINYAGLIEAGMQQIWDLSAGGTLSWTKQRVFYFEWFGVKGDGSTSDAALMRKIASMVPDYSLVLAGTNLDMAIGDMAGFRVASRSGVRFRSLLPAKSDGQGASIVWTGPAAVQGTDAAVDVGVDPFLLNSPSGKFTAAMLFARFWVNGGGQGGTGWGGSITQYISPTQVRVNVAAHVTAAGKNFIIGGVLIYLESCANVEVEGFALRPTTIAAVHGWDGYIAAGSNIFNAKGFGQFNDQMRIDGRQFIAYGAGPGGGDLVTTVTGFNNANQIVLAAAAATAIPNNVLCRYMVGPTATSLPAYTTVLSDQSGIGGTGTECEIKGNLFQGIIPIPGHRHIVIAEGTLDNQEYHYIGGNRFNTSQYRGDTSQANVTVSTITGTPNVTLSAEDHVNAPYTSGGSKFAIGQDITIPDAGGVNTPYQGKIIDQTSPTALVVSPNVPLTVAGRRAIIGRSVNQGVVIGASANAKRIIIETNTFTGCANAIWCIGGSYISQKNSFSSCETCHQRDGASEPCVSTQDNTEASGRFLYNNTSQSFTGVAARCGNGQPVANSGYIVLGVNSGIVAFEELQFDNPPPEASTKLFAFLGGNGTLLMRGTKYSPAAPITMAQVGFSPLPGIPVHSIGGSPITDAPAQDFFISGKDTGEALMAFQSQSSTRVGVGSVMDVLYQTVGGGVFDYAAYTGRVESAGGSAGGTISAFEARIGQSSVLGQNQAWAGFRVLMPTHDNVFVNSPDGVCGLIVESPALPTAGPLIRPHGVLIKPLAGTGIQQPRAFWQTGTGDANKLAGRTHLRAVREAATDDFYLDNNMFQVWTDSANEHIKLKVKKNDGTFGVIDLGLPA